MDYVQVKSAGDMFEAMKSRFLDNDIIIKAAAVADYKPKSYSDEKTKKKDGEITVQQTETSSKKVVSNEVGDYVEYEDIREETSESRRE